MSLLHFRKLSYTPRTLHERKFIISAHFILFGMWKTKYVGRRTIARMIASVPSFVSSMFLQVPVHWRREVLMNHMLVHNYVIPLIKHDPMDITIDLLHHYFLMEEMINNPNLNKFSTVGRNKHYIALPLHVWFHNIFIVFCYVSRYLRTGIPKFSGITYYCVSGN